MGLFYGPIFGDGVLNMLTLTESCVDGSTGLLASTRSRVVLIYYSFLLLYYPYSFYVRVGVAIEFVTMGLFCSRYARCFYYILILSLNIIAGIENPPFKSPEVVRHYSLSTHLSSHALEIIVGGSIGIRHLVVHGREYNL